VNDALASLDSKVDKLRVGVGRILHDLRTFASAKGSRESLVSQHDEVLQTLTQYEIQVLIFTTGLEEDQECQEIMKATETSPLFDVAVAVNDMIDRMKIKSAWCIGWLEVIWRREAAAFALPREVPAELSGFIRKLKTISRTLEKQRGDPGRSVARRKSRVQQSSMAEIDDDARRVLRVLVDNTASSGEGHTVQSLAVTTGLNEQKIRRILINRLGEGGLGLVSRKKPKRGKGRTSPSHVFFVIPEFVEKSRQIVQSR